MSEMKFLPPTMVDAMLLEIGKTMFTVTFAKQDGSTRVMNCRRGVKKHLKGGESTIKHNPDLIGVYEMNNAYRCFDKNRVLDIKGAGMCLRTREVVPVNV